MATERRYGPGCAIALLAAAVTATAEPVAVVGGTVHPVSGPPVANGILLFDGGVITAVGPAGEVAIPADARRVDATGRHVWPSLMNCYTYLGISEIRDVRSSQDHDEHGGMNPGARVEVALNVSSATLEVTRANGVLLAATLPSGGLVSGTAATIALDGWTAEELVRHAPLGLVIQWPDLSPRPDGEGRRGDEDLVRLDGMMEEARAYAEARASGSSERSPDVRWESLLRFVRGEVPAWIQARTVAQVRSALDWTARHHVPMVLLDGRGSRSGAARHVAAELAARDVPVVIRSNRLPPGNSDPYDDAFTLAGDLHAAGVRVVFGTSNATNARHVTAEAARAVAFGMPREAAERALTLGAAEVLGVPDRYGSLEVGKSATFLLVDGDVLETRMRVERAWLDGRELSLETRHTRLRDRWSARPLPGGRP